MAYKFNSALVHFKLVFLLALPHVACGANLLSSDPIEGLFLSSDRPTNQLTRLDVSLNVIMTDSGGSPPHEPSHFQENRPAGGDGAVIALK